MDFKTTGQESADISQFVFACCVLRIKFRLCTLGKSSTDVSLCSRQGLVAADARAHYALVG